MPLIAGRVREIGLIDRRSRPRDTADFNRIPGAVVRSCPKSGNFRVEDNARTSRQRTSSASLITGTPTAGRNELFNREITRNFRRLGSISKRVTPGSLDNPVSGRIRDGEEPNEFERFEDNESKRTQTSNSLRFFNCFTKQII